MTTAYETGKLLARTLSQAQISAIVSFFTPPHEFNNLLATVDEKFSRWANLAEAAELPDPWRSSNQAGFDSRIEINQSRPGVMPRIDAAREAKSILYNELYEKYICICTYVRALASAHGDEARADEIVSEYPSFFS